MYKLVGTWSAPPADRVEDFEKHYRETHVPLAESVPGLVKIIATRTGDGLPGGEPAFYRLAEMFFDSHEAMVSSSESEAWRTMRADAQYLAVEYGVTLNAAAGWEQE